MLTKNQTDRVTIPHEPGQWVEVRKLSWRQLDEARERRSRSVMENLDALPSEMLRVLREQPAQEAANGVAPEQEDDASTYDHTTLLRHGVVAWSYEEPVNDEMIADLDEATAAFFVEQVLRLARRTPAEGKGSAGS